MILLRAVAKTLGGVPRAADTAAGGETGVAAAQHPSPQSPRPSPFVRRFPWVTVDLASSLADVSLQVQQAGLQSSCARAREASGLDLERGLTSSIGLELL